MLYGCKVALPALTFADTESPNISCPTNWTVATDVNQNFATVSLPHEMSSSDNSGMFHITIDVGGASYRVDDNVTLSLAMSPHFVLYTASDNAMNNASCDVYITVIGE